METYNGKTSLMISYQYHMMDPKGGDDILLHSKDYDTLDEAYAAMERILPDDYEADDGYDLEEWNEYIAKNDPDIYLQYASCPDDDHCILAVLRPIL